MSDKEVDSTRFNPRHRILGAIILVSLAVIFIPLILNEDDTPSDLKSVNEIPPRTGTPAAGETKVVVTPLAQLGEEKVEKPMAPVPETARPPVPVPEPKKAVPVEPSEMAAPPEPTVKAAVESAPAKKEPAAEVDKPAKVSKGYIVQVGVYSHADNAQRIEQKLKRAGHPVLSDTVKIEGGKAQRIRVGPFKDKAAAEKAVAQIQKDAGIQGIMRAYP